MTMAKALVNTGTCLLVVAMSMTGLAETLGTYYLQSGGVENWVSDYTYWKLGAESGESATGPVNPNYDYVYNGNKRMKGPLASSGYAAYTFNGHSLILDCNNVNAGFLLQNDQDQTITFANDGLIFRRNAYLGSWEGSNADIYGKITVNSGVQMGIYESGSSGKAFTFHDKFYGSRKVHVHGSYLTNVYDLGFGYPYKVDVAQVFFQLIEFSRDRIKTVIGEDEDFLAFGVGGQDLASSEHVPVALGVRSGDVNVVDLVKFTDNGPDFIRQGVVTNVELGLLISAVYLS